MTATFYPQQDHWVSILTLDGLAIDASDAVERLLLICDPHRSGAVTIEECGEVVHRALMYDVHHECAIARAELWEAGIVVEFFNTQTRETLS